MDELLSAARLGAALVLMAAASLMDWRTRRVPDRVWIVMGGIGFCLLAVELLLSETDTFFGTERTFGAGHLLILVPIAILFLDTFWDRAPVYEDGKVNPVPVLLYAVGVIAALAMLQLEGMTAESGALLAIPIAMCAFIVFYYLGIVRGGADAKALLALSVLFPFYPIIANLPFISYPENTAEYLQMTFPFTFLILMNAAIIHALVGPTVRFFRNLARGDRGFPEMFLGYRMDISEVPKNFVWPMEAVRDGEVVLILFPKRSGDVKDERIKLREKGETRIWVTPKDPFIIPMTLGIIVSVVIGNFVMLFT
ncbi:MAG: A24 family peptidase C-terminal domain-containing protein [Thermoplasmata archaeon]|nr:A24 family peptidase C-terminal domain-containing protein [Thermoplasmata archaeon]